MLPTDPPSPGIYLASGPSILPSWFGKALCPGLARGGRLFWIDAGNSFDAYGISYAARRLGYDPKPLLARISLARPFNLFQLETMVTRKLPEKWRGEPVVLADPFPMFFDQDVKTEDARKVFTRVLRGIRSLAAVWMVLAVDRKAPPDRAGWPGELARGARAIASLCESGDRLGLERRER